MTVRPRPLARSALWVALAAAAVAGVAADVATGPAPAVLADDVDDAVAQLRELAKEGDEAKVIAKITEIEGKLDPRITDAFSDIARSAKSDRIAKTAMKAAAQRKDPELLKWLKTRIDDKKMVEDHKEKYLAVLDSLSFYGDKGALKGLEDVVKKYLPTDAEISKRAIAAYGSCRDKVALETLLKWLGETEKTRGGGQSGKSMSAETRKNYEEANGAVAKALQKLTLQDMGDAATWEKWWEENKKTFEFPDPNAPEPDYTTLAEYVDRAYGFTMKKPAAGAFWQFAKCEVAGGRVTLQYRDDQNVLWARVQAITWKGNGEVTSPETFAAYYEKQWREKEFAQFSKEPVIEAKKIGGRDFQVITARGMGADSWKGWESCERRVYITRANPNLFLYFECAVRSGADDPVKAAFWGAMEGLAFKK